MLGFTIRVGKCQRNNVRIQCKGWENVNKEIMLEFSARAVKMLGFTVRVGEMLNNVSIYSKGWKMLEK